MLIYGQLRFGNIWAWFCEDRAFYLKANFGNIKFKGPKCPYGIEVRTYFFNGNAMGQNPRKQNGWIRKPSNIALDCLSKYLFYNILVLKNMSKVWLYFSRSEICVLSDEICHSNWKLAHFMAWPFYYIFTKIIHSFLSLGSILTNNKLRLWKINTRNAFFRQFYIR